MTEPRQTLAVLRRERMVQSLAALVPPLLAVVLQWALWGVIEPLIWFLFYPAVFISSSLGGRRSGVIATLISIVLVWWLFIPPAPPAPTHFFSTAAFLVMGVLFGVFFERLRNANQKSEAMVTGALDCIVSMDAKGRVTEWNPAAEQIFGYAPNEAIGRDMAELIIPQRLRAQHRAGLEHYLQTGEGPMLGKRIELPAVTKDAREISVELNVTRISVGASPSFVGFLRDITAQKRAESEKNRLAEAQRLLDHATVALASSLDISETIQKAARLAVPGFADWCIVDLAGDTGELRQAAAAHVDPEKEELARRIGRDVVQQLRQGAHHFFSTGEPELLRTLGVLSYLSVPIRFRERTLGVLNLLRAAPERGYDATDVALAEEFARRIGLAVDNARLFRDAQNAIKARDEFLQVASHELKTPLTPLQMQLDLLTRGFEKAGIQNERLVAKLDSANRQTTRIVRLVESLLDVSRITGGRLELELERCDLSAVVRDVADRFRTEAKRAGSEIKVSADDAVMGTWDPLRIEQIVANLLSNAIKYGSGKPVELEVRASDDTVRVTVADRGIGMDEETLGRIFGRFQRGVSLRNYGGLGLGLFIARQFAEAHGGTIVAQSHPGAGSTFTVVLPRSPTEQTEVIESRTDEVQR